MADAREYISRPDELGTVHISEDVLAVIAAAAALEVEGVSSLAPNLGSDLAELLGKKSLSKGVHITVVEDSVSVEVSILIKYGFTIPAVAAAVQEAVFNAISNTSGLDVACVNVNVAQTPARN